MINEWELTTTNLHRLTQRLPEVAVLPTCAIEAHNWHLPEGMDYLHATYVARRSCELAWQKTPSVICLPAIPYGVDCNLLSFPLSIHVPQATLDRMVRDVIISLRHHGLRKVLILNSHGGNDFKAFVRQIQSDMDVHVFVCNWWQVGRDQYNEIFETPDEHAGEMETSVALAIQPELVEPGVAGDGKGRPFRFDALTNGWVWTSRNFARINNYAGVGDPSRASAEKGKRYLDVICGRIGGFLAELAGTPIDEHFPHIAEQLSATAFSNLES